MEKITKELIEKMIVDFTNAEKGHSVKTDVHNIRNHLKYKIKDSQDWLDMLKRFESFLHFTYGDVEDLRKYNYVLEDDIHWYALFTPVQSHIDYLAKDICRHVRDKVIRNVNISIETLKYVIANEPAMDIEQHGTVKEDAEQILDYKLHPEDYIEE